MDFVCAMDPRPLIPDGVYDVQCLRYDTRFVKCGHKLFLHFGIISEGEHFGKKIFEAFNMPKDQKLKPGSKYYKTWVMLNGGKPPSRNTKMSPAIFVNGLFRVRTRTVKPKYNGKPMPKENWYSVVDAIIERLEGGR